MKKKIAGILIFVVVLISCGVGYFIYQGNVKQEMIDKEVSKITRLESEFSETEQREEKLTILKTLIAKEKEYKKQGKVCEEVLEKYHNTISDQQKAFSEEYKNRIEENKVDNLDTSGDIELIKKSQNNLTELLSVIEKEKKITISSESEYTKYTQEIKSLIESYSERITVVEEAKKKAEEEENRKAEEAEAKTHYENEYFSVDVPGGWADCWSVTEDNSSDDFIIYEFSYNGDNATTETSSGGAMLYVVDATYGLPQNIQLPACEILGYTSDEFAIFMTEAGAGFFTHGATITMK